MLMHHRTKQVNVAIVTDLIYLLGPNCSKNAVNYVVFISFLYIQDNCVNVCINLEQYICNTHFKVEYLKLKSPKMSHKQFESNDYSSIH